MLLSPLLVCSSLLGRSYSSLGIDHLDYLKKHGFSDEDIRLMDESTVDAIHDHLERAFEGKVSLTFSTKGGCLGIGLNSSWHFHPHYAVTKNPIHYQA